MEDYNKLIDAMKHYPCIWKPYHEDYDNQKVLDQAWIDLTKRYNSAKLNNPDVVINFCSDQMVDNVKMIWITALSIHFTTYVLWFGTSSELPKPENFDRLSYLKCGLSTGFYKKYGYDEFSVRLMSRLNNRKPNNKKDSKLDTFQQFEKQLKQKQYEAKERAREEDEFVKGSLEKAVLVEFVRTNPWLWESNNAKFGNVEICEHSWRYIAKRMSESDDYYYVWKYQRMWQALVQRFLVQFQEKKKLCSHFEQIEEFIIKPMLSIEDQVSYIKKVQETSIHFVSLTNAKLAKENKRYELWQYYSE